MSNLKLKLCDEEFADQVTNILEIVDKLTEASDTVSGIADSLKENSLSDILIDREITNKINMLKNFSGALHEAVENDKKNLEGFIEEVESYESVL